MFNIKYIEAVGVMGCNEGFNQYWVYDKWGFVKCYEFSKNKILLKKRI